VINGLKTHTLPCTDWYQLYYENGVLVDMVYLDSTGDCSDAPPISPGGGGGNGGAPGDGTGGGGGTIGPDDPCATIHSVSPTQTVNSTKGVNTFNPEPPVSSDPGDGGFPPPEPPAPCVVVNPIILPLLDVSALSKYPKFKALASDLPNCLKKYPNITKALAYYTGFSEATILQLMEPGKGPKIVTVPDLKNSFGVSLYGKYDAETKTILINENFAKGFEVAQSETTIQATALLLAITTLHEFVHYGRDQNKLSDLFNGYEAGWTFEMNIDPSGTGINKNNAVKWINYYPYNFK